MRFLPVLALAGLGTVSSPSAAQAQFGRRLKDAVKRTAEDKAINKATQEESEAIDDAMSGGGKTAAADSAAPAAESAPGAKAPATASAGAATPAGATGWDRPSRRGPTTRRKVGRTTGGWSW